MVRRPVERNRVIGQIDKIVNISIGNILTLEQPLFTTYSNTPLATYWNGQTNNAGVENLQVYANNTGYATSFAMSGCAYCWISGVEDNYADGDHVTVSWSYHSGDRQLVFLKYLRPLSGDN